MKIKKLLSAVLALSVCSSLFAGCANNNDSAEKDIRLKYVMAGAGMQPNSREVWAVFNDKLHETLPNVTVDFEIIPLAEYKQKVMLMQSAREQIDILNNYSLDFTTEINNGTFIALDDLLVEYGKEVKNAIPDWVWDYQVVNGKTYGIPTYQMMGQSRAICTLKENADKYLDIDALRKALDSSPYLSEEVYKVLTEYCANAKADGLNFKSASILNVGGYDTVSGMYGIIMDDEECRVVNTLVGDQAKIRFKTAREWVEKGYIRSDALSATDNDSYNGKKDGNLFWDENYSPYHADNLTKKYGAEVITIPYDTEPPIYHKALAGGTSITSTCKYPKEAMQVLNLIQTDEEIYNLLVFGREGIDYKKISDNRIETTYQGTATANDGYGLKSWIVGNTELAYLTQSDPDNYKEYAFDEVNSSTNRSKLIGFQIDTTKIVDMLSQTNSIKGQYLQPLNVGAVENWEENYNEFREKLKIAGEEEIIAEIQKQVDEFLASKN